MLELLQSDNDNRKTRTTRGSRELFLKAVSVWINKPHVVNRRLCGSMIHYVYRCQTKAEAEQALIDSKKLVSGSSDISASWEAGQSFKDLSEEQHPFSVLVRELVPKSEFFPRLRETIVYDNECASVTFVPFNDVSIKEEAEKTLMTKELLYSIHFNVCENDVPFMFRVNEITLTWSNDSAESEMTRYQMSLQWLQSVLLNRLVSWSQVDDIKTSAKSLMLVAVDKYKDTYVRLKNTYGRDLVKNWPERTDPKKFVYEDVAIAAYLLLIWEEDRQKKGLKEKQSFVDLGCGNGLLVYILTKEGHKGLGIDLRKRKIWDMFGKDVDLREEAIKPSSEHLFPDYDWLIGNHSDELTPWIPVIAARSSPTCSFFLLPCCHHDFVGKFHDTKKGQSRYSTYVDYVKEIVECCGFSPEVDTMRIPSTKRICLIGRQRMYEPEDEILADEKRQAFINKRVLSNEWKRNSLSSSSSSEGHSSPTDRSTVGLSSLDSGYSSSPSASDDDDTSGNDLQRKGDIHCVKSPKSSEESSGKDPAYSHTNLHVRKKVKTERESHEELKSSQKNNTTHETTQSADKKWAKDFQPRVEPGIRNCQAVAEETKLKIVSRVFQLVLNSEGAKVVQLAEGKQWQKGGSTSLADVASLFDKRTLKELKDNCGGLQTLLRNHSHIFQVSGGQVMLRDFSQVDPWKGINPQKKRANEARAEQRDTRKTTLCWFFNNHPDGCPRSSTACTFAHGQSELRVKAIKVDSDAHSGPQMHSKNYHF